MRIDKKYSCCFLGHRKIDYSTDCKKRIYKIIEKLINKNIIYYIFGSKSQFNDLCYSVVSDLKLKYPHIKRIYVRAEYPNINDDYEKYLLERYEYTYFPSNILNSKKAIYIKRNYEMIDNSSYCLFYYDKNYLPNTATTSGTKTAYNYALKNNKNIINLIENQKKT